MGVDQTGWEVAGLQPTDGFAHARAASAVEDALTVTTRSDSGADAPWRLTRPMDPAA